MERCHHHAIVLIYLLFKIIINKLFIIIIAHARIVMSPLVGVAK